jgi:2-dehydro-3-deoxyphosphogalactonate aldolase
MTAFPTPAANPAQRLHAALTEMPLVAVLRGITPPEVPGVANALWQAGFRVMEVTLNSPEPLESIARLRQAVPQAVVGAGTVLEGPEVAQVGQAGGELIVAPDFNPEVARAAAAQGLAYLPGVVTPSEAFAALRAGAHGLKCFPADMVPPEAIQAMRAVLPPGTWVLAVGGITPEKMPPYLRAGASGFGTGSNLYAPGRPVAEVARRAIDLVGALRAAMNR